MSKTLREMYEEFYGTDFEIAVENNPYDEDEIAWSGAEGEGCHCGLDPQSSGLTSLPLSSTGSNPPK